MKKLIALLLALTMIFAFAACAKAPAKEETKTLTMACSADFPPYEFVNDDGSYAGIDVDIAQAICDKLGYKLEVKDMDFDGIIAAVQSGAVNFAMSGLTITDERKESVNFSDSYAKGVQVIVVKEGSKIATVDDLDGAKIGVQAGTTGDFYCTDDYGQENVSQYTKYAMAIEALKNDQVDCVVLDNEPAEAFVEANEGLKILDTAYADEDYAAAFNKDDTELLEQFNKALGELKADGTLDKIVETYINAK